ncbi:MAG: hypothetical protein HY721_05825 [Planctomycetes bacterium]|nr:hypothetical protein [Planctomycetota bacterium]
MSPAQPEHGRVKLDFTRQIRTSSRVRTCFRASA